MCKFGDTEAEFLQQLESFFGLERCTLCFVLESQEQTTVVFKAKGALRHNCSCIY